MMPRLLLLALLAPLALGAQQQTASVHPTPPPVAVAAPREGSVAIDGKLDEGAWAKATPITELKQYQPNEGQPATLATEVRILYDAQALYVGARMRDPAGR